MIKVVIYEVDDSAIAQLSAIDMHGEDLDDAILQEAEFEHRIQCVHDFPVTELENVKATLDSLWQAIWKGDTENG